MFCRWCCSSKNRSIHGVVSHLSSFFKDISSRSNRHLSNGNIIAGYSIFYSVSTIYRDASLHSTSTSVHFQRPPTIPLSEIPSFNSVSFIGSIIRPLQKYPSNDLWTLMSTESPVFKRSFRIVLEMRGKMAEISAQHLMQGDFVYVSGRLVSYTKADSSGRDMISYKVIVKELNYIKCSNQYQTLQNPKSLKLNADPISSALDDERDYNKRVLLWQSLFANPHEWWDHRLNKLNRGSPDFKHKNTGECLWIMSNDPPWVAKQLQLLDCK